MPENPAPVDPATMNTPVDKLVARVAGIADNMVGKAEFGELKALVDGAKAQVDELRKQIRDRSFQLPGSETVAKDWSMSRACLAVGQCTPDMSEDQRINVLRKYAPLEFDVSEQTRKASKEAIERNLKDLESQMTRAEAEKVRATNTTLTDSGGGLLVPMQVLDKWYEIFYAALVLDKAGISKITGLTGDPVLVPKEATGTTVYMVPENSVTGLTNSEQTFQMLAMRAREAVATGSYSQRLLALANPSIDALMTRSFMQKLARKVEQQVFTGKGSNGEVRGILTGAGGTGNNPHLEGNLQDIADLNLANGSNTILQMNVIDFEGVLEDADALMGTATIITHPKVRRKFRKDTANQYTLPVPLSPARIKEITGYDWLVTTQLPTNLSRSTYTNDGSLAHFILGEFANLLLGLWGGVTIRRSDVAYSPITSTSAFHQRLVHVLVSQLFDSGVIRKESIVASNEINYT